MANITFQDGFTDMSFLNLQKQTIKSKYAEAIELSKNSQYQTKGLILNFEIDNQINACTWIENQQDHLNITTGTFTNIYSLFYTAFSNSEVFPKIGDSSRETNARITGIFDPNSKHLLYTGEPKDNDRRIIANYTAMLAINYIFLHELGHLLNGHCNLLNTLYNTEKIEMIVKERAGNFSKKQRESYALIRRTLEMDADAFAASMGMDNITALYEENSHPYINMLENRYQLFEIWAFAVHNVFMLFEFSSPSSYDEYSYYLPNVARELLSLESANTAIRMLKSKNLFNYNQNEYKKINEYIFRGIERAESFFNGLYNTSFNFIEQYNTTEYKAYSKKVLEYWNIDLRFKLQKYARAILYNPEDMNGL